MCDIALTGKAGMTCHLLANLIQLGASVVPVVRSLHALFLELPVPVCAPHYGHLESGGIFPWSYALFRYLLATMQSHVHV
jgi:hypothetical protein